MCVCATLGSTPLRLALCVCVWVCVCVHAGVCVCVGVCVPEAKKPLSLIFASEHSFMRAAP